MINVMNDDLNCMSLVWKMNNDTDEQVVNEMVYCCTDGKQI